MTTILRTIIQRIRHDRGNALIELAVGMSILSTIILGAAEFGRIAHASIEISDAAHAGAAYAAQSRTFAADTANANTAATNDATDAGASATTTYWCQCSNGGSSTCAATDCSTSRIIEYVTVTTTGTVNPMIYVPGLPHSYTVTGRAVMRVEQ